MGATPVSALATAMTPLAGDRQTEADLVQLLAGAVAALNEAKCALVGGHTCEGAELALGASAARARRLFGRGGGGYIASRQRRIDILHARQKTQNRALPRH